LFAIVDCNNSYASCERLFAPHLIGKPIAVLSNNDGCVIARSDEAKALGVTMEVYSIDEAFLDLSGFEHHGLNDYAQEGFSSSAWTCKFLHDSNADFLSTRAEALADTKRITSAVTLSHNLI
jgi:nucleotidyltransferase/DNA polymerase involved in DNA repair